MKNKMYLVALLTTALTTSCYQSQNDVMGETQKRDVQFSLQCMGVEESAMTRADGVTVGEPTKLMVYDKYEGTISAEVLTTTSSVTLPLAYGEHDLYFVASVKEWKTANTNEMKMEWGNSRNDMSAVWGYHQTLTVSATTAAQSVTMPLIASCVAVMATDKGPTNFARLDVDAPGVCRGLNVATMKGYVVTDQKVALQLGGSSGSAVSVKLFSLVPSDGGLGDVTLTAYGSESGGSTLSELSQRTLQEVTVEAGKVYNYTGYLFSTESTIPLTYATSWTDEVEKTF